MENRKIAIYLIIISNSLIKRCAPFFFFWGGGWRETSTYTMKSRGEGQERPQLTPWYRGGRVKKNINLHHDIEGVSIETSTSPWYREGRVKRNINLHHDIFECFRCTRRPTECFWTAGYTAGWHDVDSVRTCVTRVMRCFQAIKKMLQINKIP